MSENANEDEDVLGKSNTESDQPSDKNISSIPPEVTPPIRDTPNMDTHAHHLHHAPGKKLGHYFYEFLMLFLAIFCGFLAENWREHYVENQREKQYARQLVADLRADSLQFARVYTDMRRVINKQEEFINLMSAVQRPTDKEIITGIVPLQWVYRVNKTSSTYDQMKASGSLRYFGNSKLINSIQRYYEIMIPYSETMADQSMRIYTSYFEPFSLDHFRRGDIDIISDTLINKDPVYRNRSEESDFKLRNIIVIYREYLSISLESVLVKNINKVNELIDELNKEYSLK